MIDSIHLWTVRMQNSTFVSLPVYLDSEEVESFQNDV